MAFLLDSHQEEIEYVYPFICGLCGFGSSNIDVFHHHFVAHSENVPSSVFHRCELDDTVYNDTDLILNIGSYSCKTCSHTFPTVCHLVKHLEEDSNTDRYIMGLQTKTVYPLTTHCTSVLSHSMGNKINSYSSHGKWSSSPKTAQKLMQKRSGIGAKSLRRGGKCGPKQTSEQRLDLHSFDELLQQVEYQQRAAISSNVGDMNYADYAENDEFVNDDDSNIVSHIQVPETIVQKSPVKRKRTTEGTRSKRSKPGEWFCCKFCGISYRNDQKRIDHEKEHETEEGDKKYKPDKLCTCDTCGCVMLKLRVHLHFCPFKEGQKRPRAKVGEPKKDKDKTPVPCPYCSTVVKRYILSQHVRDKHMEQDPVVCDTCGKVFKHKSALSRHKAIHRPRLKYVCSKCGKGQISRTRLKWHMLSHDSVRTFQCDLCPAKYKFPKNLKYHKERIHAGKKEVFQCDKCPKHYSHRHSLMYHLKHGHNLWDNPEQERISKEKVAKKAERRKQNEQNENKQKSYQCVICKHIENTRGGLNQHLKTHMKEDGEGHSPYVCNECPLKYSSLDGLKRHMKTKHGPQSNYHGVCEKCDRSFNTPEALRMHKKRNHSTENKYLFCDQGACRRKFTDKEELEKHRKTHLDAKIFKCQKCSKTFSTMSGLSYHWFSQHPKIYKLPELPKEVAEKSVNADDELTTASESDKVLGHTGVNTKKQVTTANSREADQLVSMKVEDKLDYLNADYQLTIASQGDILEQAGENTENQLTAVVVSKPLQQVYSVNLKSDYQLVDANDQLTTPNKGKTIVEQVGDSSIYFQDNLMDIEHCLEDHSYTNTEVNTACEMENFDESLPKSGEIKYFRCNGCDITFVTRNGIKQHLADIHKIQLNVDEVTRNVHSSSVCDINKADDIVQIECKGTEVVAGCMENTNNNSNNTEAVINVNKGNNSKVNDISKDRIMSKPKVVLLTKVISKDAANKKSESTVNIQQKTVPVELSRMTTTKKIASLEQNMVPVEQNRLTIRQSQVNLEQNIVSKDHVSTLTGQKNADKEQQRKVVKTFVIKNVKGKDYKELCDPEKAGSNSDIKSMTLFIASKNKQSPDVKVKKPVKVILRKI